MLRFARGSFPWLAAPLVVALALGLVGLFVAGLAWLAWTALIPLVLFGLLAAFFRDPDRPVAEGEATIASPADGKVVFVDQVEDADVGTAERFSIFMHPKDVHVNRVPLDATVVSVNHIAGKHIPAFNKESERNERVETVFRLADGTPIKVIQIAGAVARRIVPYLTAGQEVRKGDRMGLIRLGSRCDLLVPPGRATWTVPPGTQVHGAMDSLGTWNDAPEAPTTVVAVFAPADTQPPKATRGSQVGKPAAKAAAKPGPSTTASPAKPAQRANRKGGA